MHFLFDRPTALAHEIPSTTMGLLFVKLMSILRGSGLLSLPIMAAGYCTSDSPVSSTEASR